jgi:ribosomal protein L11 methylase PrmA
MGKSIGSVAIAILRADTCFHFGALVAKGRDSGMPSAEQWEAFFQPGGILEALGCVCMSGDVVEFGCGYGTFTVAAASRVSGIVYATDIDPLMIGATITRASQAGLRNVIAEQRDFVSEGCGRPDAEHGRKRPDFSG